MQFTKLSSIEYSKLNDKEKNDYKDQLFSHLLRGDAVEVVQKYVNIYRKITKTA